MELKVFSFYAGSPYSIENEWKNIKKEYPDAIFEQVIVEGDSYYILAFI